MNVYIKIILGASSDLPIHNIIYIYIDNIYIFIYISGYIYIIHMIYIYIDNIVNT